MSNISFWIFVFVLSCGLRIQNNHVTSTTSQWRPVTLTHSSLKCWRDPLIHKRPFHQFMFFTLFSTERLIILCRCTSPSSHLASCTPTRHNVYPANYLDTLSHETPRSISLLHVIPNNRWTIERSLIFRNMFFWRRGAISHLPPLVGCPQEVI